MNQESQQKFVYVIAFTDIKIVNVTERETKNEL